MENVVATPTCWHCRQSGTITLTDDQMEGYHLWLMGGVAIQDALPSLSVGDREQIKTGIHSECFEAMFGDC